MMTETLDPHNNPMDDVTTILIREFTKHLVSIGVDTTVEMVRRFTAEINKDKGAPDGAHDERDLPTAGIIGIGRCGTHIALDLAHTIYEAREELSKSPAEASVPASPDDRSRNKPSQQGVLEEPKQKGKVLESLKTFYTGLTHGSKSGDNGRLLLIDPVILAADLDGNVKGTIQSSKLQSGGPHQIRFALTDLTWLQKGGAGNIPIIAQYLATLALLIPREKLPQLGAEAWEDHRSYFIESAGLNDNKSRLFIFLFSCGGGSGSGMASVLGMAQQNAMIQNILGRPTTGVPNSRAFEFRINEPICSLGIGILPEMTEVPNAQHLNAGRLLCRFLAHQNRFDLMKADNGAARLAARRMFNCLLLVSNEIMALSFGTDKDDADTSLSQAESMANHYIGQQIFNLLAAQAMITDYEKDFDRGKQLLGEAGITDTIRLDANDLNNSLSGPTAVAYAEGSTGSTLSLIELFRRAIALPTYRPDETLIEGISILPTSHDRYKPILEKAVNGDYAPISGLKFFRCAFSVVAVISVPKLEMLRVREVKDLRSTLERCFPNAKIRRYAVVQGSSKNPSLTLFIVGTACSTREAFSHFFRYIKGSFTKKEVTVDQLNSVLKELLAAEVFDASALKALILPVESLDRVIVGVAGSLGQWDMNKLTYQQRYASYLPKNDDKDILLPSLEIDELLVSAEEVIDALEYMHRLEHQPELEKGGPDIY